MQEDRPTCSLITCLPTAFPHDSDVLAVILWDTEEIPMQDYRVIALCSVEMETANLAWMIALNV